jgi:hypothetical protein
MTELRRPKDKFDCPRCSKTVKDFPSLSRRDKLTKICSKCGLEEGLFDYLIFIEYGILPFKDIDNMISKEREWLFGKKMEIGFIEEKFIENTKRSGVHLFYYDLSCDDVLDNGSELSKYLKIEQSKGFKTRSFSCYDNKNFKMIYRIYKRYVK